MVCSREPAAGPSSCTKISERSQLGLSNESERDLGCGTLGQEEAIRDVIAKSVEDVFSVGAR